MSSETLQHPMLPSRAAKTLSGPGPAKTNSAVGQPVHLLGGMPTEGVLRGFDRLRAALPVLPFSDFVGMAAAQCAQKAVLLPPFIETSELIEDWEACGYLVGRFGEDAHIGSATTVVDADALPDLMASAQAISARGWGKSPSDARTVADVAVGQIESATHLLLVGDAEACDVLGPLLGLLNPRAVRRSLAAMSDDALRAFLDLPWQGADPGKKPGFPSARVLPPWLEWLQADIAPPRASGRLFLYRRSRPFDPERFGEWLADPPTALVRGKGNVWLANRPDQAFGYSCAGSVHRVFGAGRWWAGSGGAQWPTCETARRRLLDRWHPRFGDRRQEIALMGLGLDREAIASGLDACLLSEAETIELFPGNGLPIDATAERAHPAGLH